MTRFGVLYYIFSTIKCRTLQFSGYVFAGRVAFLITIFSSRFIFSSRKIHRKYIESIFPTRNQISRMFFCRKSAAILMPVAIDVYVHV